MHQTLLVTAAFYIVDAVDHGPIPYAFIAVTTPGLSFGAYELVRRTRPTRLMFGLKGTPPAAKAVRDLPSR